MKILKTMYVIKQVNADLYYNIEEGKFTDIDSVVLSNWNGGEFSHGKSSCIQTAFIFNTWHKNNVENRLFNDFEVEIMEINVSIKPL